MVTPHAAPEKGEGGDVLLHFIGQFVCRERGFMRVRTGAQTHGQL